jgi:hypothetical protein
MFKPIILVGFIDCKVVVKTLLENCMQKDIRMNTKLAKAVDCFFTVTAFLGVQILVTSALAKFAPTFLLGLAKCFPF